MQLWRLERERDGKNLCSLCLWLLIMMFPFILDYRAVCLHHPAFSHFSRTPTCDRQTHADRHRASAYTVLNIHSSRGFKVSFSVWFWQDYCSKYLFMSVM